MKAVVLRSFGGVEELEQQETAVPNIKDDEVLIQTKAISINPVDVKTRAGKGIAGRLKNKLPIILGWDVSGIVTEVGASVTDLKKGDEVFGMINFPGIGSAYAAYVAAPAWQVAKKPSNISYEEAAAATLAALTAFEVLEALNVQKGDRLLVHAAAGGVGHFAVQMAKHLGAYVIGTASAANRDFVLELGANEHIDYKAQPLDEVLSGVDKVLDTLGGENIDLSLKLMKPGGMIVSLPSGKNDGVQDKAAAMGMTGIALMVQSNGKNQQAIADLMEKEIVKAHVSRTFPLDKMGEAHLQVETGRTVGKIIVVV